MAELGKKEEPKVAEIDDNEFELMFAEVGKEESDLSKPKEEPAKEEPKAEEPAKEEPAKEEPKAEEPAKEEPTPEEVKATKEEPKAEEPKPTPTAAQIAAEQLKIQESKDEEKRVTDAAKVKEDELKAKATLAEDELALKVEVEKDFPDVAKLMATQQRISDAKTEIRMAEFQDNLIKQLGPTMQTVQAVATDSWERAVFDKHPDTVELLPEVEKWVETQPKFLQAGYNAVLDKGTPAETIELMDTFKTATGRNEDADKVAADKVAAEKLAAEEAAKEKKLKSQEGVRGRSAPKKETEPSDFEGGFKSVKAVA